MNFIKRLFFTSSAVPIADGTTPVTSIYPLGEPSADERFYSRRNRRSSRIWRNSPERALFHLDDDVLIDLDPGLLTWRAGGCQVTESKPDEDPTVSDVINF